MANSSDKLYIERRGYGQKNNDYPKISVSRHIFEKCTAVALESGMSLSAVVAIMVDFACDRIEFVDLK